MAKETHIAIRNKTRGTIPRLPFADMARDVLGARYELSVGFVTPAESARLARTYKHKDYAANVLSFRLSKTSGELVIAPAVARKQAKEFGTDFRGMLCILFIHGLFHLKGHTHGGTMESAERRMVRKYSAA